MSGAGIFNFRFRETKNCQTRKIIFIIVQLYIYYDDDEGHKYILRLNGARWSLPFLLFLSSLKEPTRQPPLSLRKP
jgi:hypothetical protein